MYTISLAATLLLSAISNTAIAGDDKWVSPEYKNFFETALPIPPEIKPLRSYDNATSGQAIDFYQLNVTAFEKQIYPGKGKAQLVGYNGMSPGPTFRIKRGRHSVVRVINEYDRDSVVHLHGSYTRPVWDGWAEDVIKPGEYKDYYYPNMNAARTMWYHDHAMGITALNAYTGQAGFYIVEDDEVEDRLKLPQGKYDIPLALSSKQYTKNGDLLDISKERESIYGDVIQVNGQPWPFLTVEPRKYRFRVLNTAISRTFMLSLTANKNNVPFQVVASDSGFMESTVTTSKLTVAMAERWEIIVDFASYAGQTITMKNERDIFKDDDYAATDKVMQFHVGSKTTSDDNNGPVPSDLVSLDLPKPSSDKVDREFKFERKHDTYLINGVGFADVKNRILANPSRGKTEIWSLENHSGKWSHPIHVHMVDFKILSRKKGRETVEEYESHAMKDVVVLGPDERVKIAVKFAPMEGIYMFHCHNLMHEDHDMMAAFDVKSVKGLGYTDSDLSFSDPMSAQWRAQPYDKDSVSTSSEVFSRFASTGAYNNITGMQDALEEYWSSHSEESSAQAVTPRGTVIALTLLLVWTLFR